MGRGTVYNENLTANYDQVSEQNKNLVNEYIRYLKSNDKSTQTIDQYVSWLKIFFCWNQKENENKFFIDLKKRDFIYYIGYLRELGLSSNRIASLKSAVSAFSNAIEILYEDEYPNFRNRLRGLEAVHIAPVREKTVLSADELEQLLQKLVDQQDYQLACYISLACASGARKAELLQMKTSYFKGGSDEKLVFNNQFYLTKPVRAKGRGKQGKMLQKYVIKSMFDPFFDLWMAERQKLNITCDSLFVVKDGEIYKPASVSTINSFMRTASNVANKPIYSHSFRHHFCSMLKSLEFPNDIITEIFGWANESMVAVYDDTPKEEKLAKWFNNFSIGGNKTTSIESVENVDLFESGEN